MKAALLVLLAIALSFLSAQISTSMTSIPLTPDPDMLHGTLANGMKYYIVQNSVPANRLELRLHIDAGSIVEDEDQLGLAHFTEHMAFNGTKRFTKQAARDYLASIGVGQLHGYTGSTNFDYTKYQLRIPTDDNEQLEMGFMILADIAHQISFDPEELELERGVVLEELRFRTGWSLRLMDQYVEHSYRGSRYPERFPAGKADVISSFDRDTIVRFYSDWYRPDLQSIIIVGDLPKAEALALVEKHFGVIPARNNPRPRESYSIPAFAANRAMVFTDPDLHFSSIGLNWVYENTPLRTADDYQNYLLRELISTMFDQRIRELVATQNPPFSSAAFASEYGYGECLESDLAAWGVSEGKSVEAFTVLIREWERVLQHGFTLSELERAKVSQLRMLEAERDKHGSVPSAEVAEQLFDCVRFGKIMMNPEQQLTLARSILGEVEPAAVNSLARQMTQDKKHLLWYYGPQKEEAIPPTEDQMLGIQAKVLREKIEPYVDTEIPETLLSEMPKAGSIVKESVRKDSGIKEWILSNGVRVYSKQTDFKKDEILFAAKSPGGYSEYPLAQSFDARFLGDYLYLTGAGELDRASLVKALTGKIAEIGFDVDNSSHQINGSTTPKDLETLFQLIYLFGTQARFDEQSFGVYTATIGPSMEFISNEANLVFADSLASIRWQRHPMLRNKNINHFNSLEPSSLQQIHRDLFGNYADFTFLFVGSFDEDALKEYCKTYLANLPVGKKKGKLEAKAIAPFNGKETVSFKKGSTARAQVTHITSGYCEKDTDSGFARLALNMLLTRKLLENIRERMSGVYLIYSQFEEIEHSGNGRPAYSLAINMHCDPLREEELSAAIMATLDSLRAGYYDESYVQEIKAQLSKVYEDAFGTNEYFCKVISKNLYSPREIDCYLQNPGRIEKLDKKIITDAAKRHLSFDKSHRKLVMLPEDPISLE